MLPELLPTVLTSTVIVAVLAIVQQLVGKWRSRGERQTQGFAEMQAVANAHAELAQQHMRLANEAQATASEMLTKLAEANQQLALFRVRVTGLETALESAYDTIARMMDLVKSLESEGLTVPLVTG